MADRDRRDHIESKVAGLELPYFRELVLDTWGLRGFGVAHRYAGKGADFVAVRDEGAEPETEMVAVAEHGETETVRSLAEAAEGGDEEVTAVAVAREFSQEASSTARELGVETVDAARLADLLHRGEYYWTLYRWVALSEAEEPSVVGRGEAPLRYEGGRKDGRVKVGRAAAERVGVSKGDVVRVCGEAAGVAEKGGLFEKDRDYASVSEGYEGSLDAEEGDTVTVEVLDTGEARRVYVLSEPRVDEDVAAEVWKGYAPYTGMELSQPYGDGGGEMRTMALEVLPHDYCHVSDETDVVVEGYAGARRVFE